MGQAFDQLDTFTFKPAMPVAIISYAGTDTAKTDSARLPPALSLLIVTAVSILLWTAIILLVHHFWLDYRALG
jgi:hypothetical protein